MILKLALREIRSNPRFAAGFCSNLALGLFGFVLLSAFQGAVEKSFQNRSRALLTADLAVSARRALTPEELRRLRQLVDSRTQGRFTETHTVEMYSMVSAGDRSRLVEVVAVGPGFPLHGEIILQGGARIVSDTARTLDSSPDAWISPELATQMELRPGTPLSIGDQAFQTAQLIEQDASTGWRGFSFAPRLYIGLPWLERTGLVRKGSTVSHAHLFRTEPGFDLDSLVRELNQTLDDPGIRVVTHRTAGERMTRTLSYLGDYLGLVALVGLFLAALGGAYLFHSFLSRRLREIATLISLGLTHAQALWVYLVQSLVLGAIASVAAISAALIALPPVHGFVADRLGTRLPFDAGLAEIAPILGAIFAAGIGISVLTCLPLAMKIRRLKPSALFQESSIPTLSALPGRRFDRASVLAALPALVAAYAMSVVQAHSWRVGSLFFFGLLLSASVLALLASGLLRWIGRTGSTPRGRADPMTLMSIRYLSRNRLSSVSAFIAIGLGALLINLVPQLQRSIESEIEHPEVSSVPSLFLFDIQEEQLDALKDTLRTEGIELTQVSPMVRARLESINGTDFQKPIETGGTMTREDEREARSRNRGFNLTYREGLSESETLIAGKPFGSAGAEVPEVSIEQRFADRIGIKLGDVLRFEIESIPVEGRVTSLRKVRWTSFQPNFFVVFQPGALEDAPKTFLASIQKLGLEHRNRIQSRLVADFNNVSIIDVTSVVQKMLQAFQHMALALRLMAVLAVLAGLVVLFSIASHQARSRSAEIQLLKVLGAGNREVSWIFLVEFGSIGLVSAALGVLISTGLSFGISSVLFDSAWSFDWSLPAMTVVGVTLLTVITTQIAALRSIRLKPAALLAGENA